MASGKRVLNFLPGPARLPEEILQEAARDMLNYKGLGYGVMEMSHRSPEFAAISNNAINDLRNLLNIPDNYKVLFMHGGAIGMFSAVPLNFLTGNKTADYIVTGIWSDKAAKEAEKYGKVHRVVPKMTQYVDIPSTNEWKFSDDADYVYYCWNETVNGVEFNFIPESNGKPLICDMSSNFLTREFDITKFACIFASAQKNTGPAGIAVVIVREDMLGKEASICPAIWNFKKQVESESRLNTPPCFIIYMTGLNLKWTRDRGGVKYFQEQSKKKSALLYQTIENSKGFYTALVNKEHQSRVNVIFRVALSTGSDVIEKKFIAESNAQGLVGLKGHRSIGGCRASLYSAVQYEDVEMLCKFMEKFCAENRDCCR